MTNAKDERHAALVGGGNIRGLLRKEGEATEELLNLI